jgi:hypothetical protein
MDTWGYNGKTKRKHEDLLATGRSSKYLEIHTHTHSRSKRCLPLQLKDVGTTCWTIGRTFVTNGTTKNTEDSANMAKTRLPPAIKLGLNCRGFSITIVVVSHKASQSPILGASSRSPQPFSGWEEHLVHVRPNINHVKQNISQGPRISHISYDISLKKGSWWW